MRRDLRLAVALAMIACFSGAARAEEPDPLADAKVGEWTLYRMTGSLAMKQLVTKVENKKVTVLTETWRTGKLLGSNDVVVDLEVKAAGDAPAAPGPKAKVEEGTVEVKGKKLACKITSFAGDKTYVSLEVPVRGLVKVEGTGAVMLLLVDWGTDGKAGEAPAMPADAAPPEGAAAPKDVAPPKDDAAKDAAPKDAAPKDAAPKEAPAESPRTKSLDDVTITVTALGPTKTERGTILRDYHSFKASIKNDADAKRTVKGKISLDGGASGECTIYAEIEKGQTVEKILKCKQKAAWTKWDFEIERVYKF